jgi:hypothetical protein
MPTEQKAKKQASRTNLNPISINCRAQDRTNQQEKVKRKVEYLPEGTGVHMNADEHYCKEAEDLEHVGPNQYVAEVVESAAHHGKEASSVLLSMHTNSDCTNRCA